MKLFANEYSISHCVETITDMQTPDLLTLYVDPSWRKEALIHSMLLNPFWGVSGAHDNAVLRTQLAKKHEFDTTYYTITDDVTKADMVFMPYSHRDVRRSYPELLALCTDVSAQAQLPLLIDGIEDVPHPITVPNSYVLRYGGYRFEKTAQEIIIPPFANDLLEAQCEGKLSIRPKGDVPSIGFAGWSSLTPYQALRSTVKELPDRIRGIFDSRYRAKKKGVFFRAQAVRILQNTSLVTFNLLMRRSYSGHAKTAEKDIQTLQKEFVDNLLSSDYGLDIRGDANASTRLFEILSLGRIPVIIDTERNMPFADVVDYNSFSLTVDFRKLRQLPRILADFHKSLPQEQFEAMQRHARDAYVQHFRIDALMPHIIRELKQKGAVV